ncbi:MAG: hypothetical protein RL274_1724 [Pseudomonadota bacterium]|jgi:hypothetical protein
MSSTIRAGTGNAIGADQYFTGQEAVPGFLLLADGGQWQV